MITQEETSLSKFIGKESCKVHNTSNSDVQKLLKQIDPYESGWNGTFNGRLLPSDDY